MLMRGSSYGTGAAVIAAMTLAADAQAVELDRFVGRWAVFALDECAHADDSEAAPLFIRQEGGETQIGNYVWLCSVKEWTTDGEFLVGSARACGQEGGDETYDTRFRIWLNAQDQLVMAEGEGQTLNTYLRCPKTK